MRSGEKIHQLQRSVLVRLLHEVERPSLRCKTQIPCLQKQNGFLELMAGVSLPLVWFWKFGEMTPNRVAQISYFWFVCDYFEVPLYCEKLQAAYLHWLVRSKKLNDFHVNPESRKSLAGPELEPLWLSAWLSC